MMKTSYLLIVFVLLASLVLIGCGTKETAPLAVPTGAQAGDLTDLKDCEFQAGGEKYAAECGTLVVPENWDKPGSRLIALPVVRISSNASAPAEPVFLLQAGPG